jgi:cytosine/adenosine deaminase-related metal-dependent hydrolase
VDVRATHVWTPTGLVRDHVVEVNAEGWIGKVRPAQPTDPPAERGLLIPGLVNAHAHVELSWLAGRVPGGSGLQPWVGRLLVERARPCTEEERLGAVLGAARAMVSLGTAGISDVCGGPQASAEVAPILAQAGLSGVMQCELLTLDASLLRERIHEAVDAHGEILGAEGRIVVRPSPHALYSTAPALVRACVLGVPNQATPIGRPPASIHVAEDREELRFLRDGSGAWSAFLDRLHVDWRWWVPPMCSPIDFLEQIGVLGPDLLLVHGVHTMPRDRTLIARSGASLCLCPRSNHHIGGELPDVVALLDAGVRLCLGTDSLASSPDLDVLGEIPILAEACPNVDASVWLFLATEGGATGLRLPHLGRIEAGRAPGLLLLEDVSSPADLVAAAPTRRRWLARPGVA